MADKRLIVGLGNPGKDYEHTRHNIGFLVVQRLSEILEIGFSASPAVKGLTAQGKTPDASFFLLMPQTYMNLSGIAVNEFMRKKGIGPEHLLVVTDDFHLPFGQLRFRPRGSDGGHNGLGSVIEQLGTDDFCRLRVGVGEPKHGSVTEYVLGRFSKEEAKALKAIVEASAAGCLVWLREGINKAMEHYNKRKNDGK